MQRVSFDIVVPHYGNGEVLKRMFDSLSKIEQFVGPKRIVVVENGPKLNGEQVCNQYSFLPIDYVYTEVAGLSNARNCGIKKTNSDFVIFFDNDIGFSKVTFTAYQSAFNEYGQNYFYGGPVTPVYSKKPPNWMLRYVPPSVKGFNLGDNNFITDNSLFLGGNHALSRRAINSSLKTTGMVYEGESATGETGGGVGEEHRLQSRLIKNGFKGCYVAEANVYHPVKDECLTHNWICNRRYRRGITDANNQNMMAARLQFRGIPIWVVKRYIVCGFLEITFKTINPERAVFWGVQRAWAKGVIDGMLRR